MSKEKNDNEDFLARWLANDLTDEERVKFEASKEAEEYNAILDSVERLSLPTYDVESALSQLNAAKGQIDKDSSTKTVFFAPVWRVAIAAVLIISISLIYFLTKPNYTEFETFTAENTTIVLPDNSIVELNASSSLKYDPETFEENRILYLEGEAFFEVTKGINFEVVTDQGTIKVLGTSFNVRYRNDLLDVICYTGKVNVSKNTISQDLIPGEGVRIKNSILTNTWSKTLLEKPSWIQNGVTELEDVTLLDALSELKNVYGIEFKSNNSLNSIPYTGAFPNNNEETAIQQVLSPLRIDYTYDTAKRILTLEGILGQ